LISIRTAREERRIGWITRRWASASIAVIQEGSRPLVGDPSVVAQLGMGGNVEVATAADGGGLLFSASLDADDGGAAPLPWIPAEESHGVLTSRQVVRCINKGTWCITGFRQFVVKPGAGGEATQQTRRGGAHQAGGFGAGCRSWESIHLNFDLDASDMPEDRHLKLTTAGRPELA